MAAASRPPFRADHVGSLLRPPSLKALRDDVAAGRASLEALRAAEDAAIREVVALQESAGLQGITDGELMQGVRYKAGGATTHSLVMRSRSGTIRNIISEHKLQKLKSYAAVDFEH